MRTALSLLLVPPPKSRVVSRAVLARRTFPYLFKRGAYAASPVIAAASDKRMSEGETMDIEKMMKTVDTNPMSSTFWEKVVYEHTQAEGTKVPWDVGFAQPAIEEVSSRFRGKVLDAGCGLGDNTRWLGTLPTVSAAVGVDISRAAIEEARMRLERDEERGERVAQPPVEFRVASLDAPPPAGEEGEFDAVLDAGVYHCVEDQAKYLEAMTTRVKPGGVAVALEFSDANPDMPGPRRMSKEALRSGWEAAGWDVERIDDVRFMTRPTPQLGTSAAALRLIATRKPRA